MPGFRKYNDPDEKTVKLTLLVPVDLDRQLRTLSAGRGIGVGPMIREWLIEKVLEARDVAAD